MSIYSQKHKKGYIYTVQKNPELFRVKMDGTDSNRCNKIQQKHKEAPADNRNDKKKHNGSRKTSHYKWLCRKVRSVFSNMCVFKC